MFQYDLLEGNANTILNTPYSIVLTQSTAKALFGNKDPLNKVVRFDNENDLKVTGVLMVFVSMLISIALVHF
jgi:putative ABC transport system permease protein